MYAKNYKDLLIFRWLMDFYLFVSIIFGHTVVYFLLGFVDCFKAFGKIPERMEYRYTATLSVAYMLMDTSGFQPSFFMNYKYE